MTKARKYLIVAGGAAVAGLVAWYVLRPSPAQAQAAIDQPAGLGNPPSQPERNTTGRRIARAARGTTLTAGAVRLGDSGGVKRTYCTPAGCYTVYVATDGTVLSTVKV